jgi:hypothetical protein
MLTNSFSELNVPIGEGCRPFLAPSFLAPYGMAGSDEAENDGSRKPARIDRAVADPEDLPYRVELWDEAKQVVEQVLAVTSNASIGYAAYYAATREFPQRYVTLRHKRAVVSRWNGPEH